VETEFKVGDRARVCGYTLPVTILAIDDDLVWTTTDKGSHGTYHAYLMTRIEPAVPQAKFCVGQRVQRPYPRIPGEVVAVRPNTLYYYDVKWSDGVCQGVGESELEAVPEVCPTCGGKVGDG